MTEPLQILTVKKREDQGKIKAKVAESVTQFSEERIFTVCKIPTLVLPVYYWPETMIKIDSNL